MTLRVVVVEDEPPALRHLLSTIAEIPEVQIVGAAGDGALAVEMIHKLCPDLVILDINMPGLTGLEVAQALDRRNGPEVMFLTAHGGFAVDAFELDAADYLLKPLRDDRLREAIERVRRRIAGRRRTAGPASLAPLPAEGDAPNAIWAPTRRGKVLVDAASIHWIEAAGDYVLVHTAVRSHMVRHVLSDLEQIFTPDQLLRVHRSAMVNVGRVRGFRRPSRGRISLLLDHEVEVAVGASYARAVAHLLNGFAG